MKHSWWLLLRLKPKGLLTWKGHLASRIEASAVRHAAADKILVSLWLWVVEDEVEQRFQYFQHSADARLTCLQATMLGNNSQMGEHA